MLGRRHYRIKVLQALYAFFQGGEIRMEVAEKNLLQSIDKMVELFYLQLSFLLEVMHFYEFRLAEGKNKFFPTETDLNPNTKLLENKLLTQLQQNIPLQEQIKRYKISWTEEQEMVRKVFQKIRNSKDHLEYLNSGNHSYEEDADFFTKLYRKFIAKSPDLQFYCEEKNLYWEDDFDVAAVFILKTLKLFHVNVKETDSIETLFHKDYEEDPGDDRKFILGLFEKTILHSEEYEGLIETRTRNWELERIAMTDIILLKMALTELIHFSQIPVKVTMNEYIELSKKFSSNKSKQFINGILDKLVADLTADKKIKKRGRGLMT